MNDAVPEAMNRAHEPFGQAGPGRIPAAMPSGLGAGKRVDAGNSEVREFSERIEMADDVTVLVVRWQGPQKPVTE
ncbi:MAG: hypothetical protein ACRET6_08535 [Burkholderiales bacterium]